MTSIFSKAVVAASVLVFISGTAQAKGFLEQAVIDAGNGLKAVGSVVAPPRPGPSEPARSPSPPMSPCTLSPGACQTAPKS